MSIYSNKVGLRNVGSYMVSGRPWVTGSAAVGFPVQDTIQHTFPFVTKSFTIVNKGTVDLLLHFHPGQNNGGAPSGEGVSNGKTYSASDHYFVRGNYVTIPANNGAVTMDVKCGVVYLSNPDAAVTGSYELYAELTEIPSSSMYELTGSGITGN